MGLLILGYGSSTHAFDIFTTLGEVTEQMARDAIALYKR